MKTLIFGCNGQLGRALVKYFPQAIAVGRKECDLSDLSYLEKFLSEAEPDCIINASAYTAVDLAESHMDEAYGVNCIAPQAMASYAAAHQIPIVHYSTDYVFDGHKTTSYCETDEVNPLSVYGQSKAAGEKAVQATCMIANSPYYILRTSWVYGSTDGEGGNFIKTILRLAGERDQLKVVADQRGAPTSAEWLAKITKELLMHEPVIPYGIYHAVPRGETTWHGLASLVITVAKDAGADILIPAEQIIPIPASNYPVLAPRPANSRMDYRQLLNVLGSENWPHWQEQVTVYVQELVKMSRIDRSIE
jgi:dTDP-4-dehydrorhamnose reductase